jgi:putative membrane protein
MSFAPAALDDRHASKLKDLQETEAEDFDEDYMDLQKAAHRKAVRLFKDYADDGEHAALKSFAASTLASLEAHKEHANKLEEKVD